MAMTFLMITLFLNTEKGQAFYHNLIHKHSTFQRTNSVLALDASKVSISDAYDGGNIEFLGYQQQKDNVVVSLNIKPDPFTELERTSHLQYFSFRSAVNVDPDQTLQVEYVIENAANASYPSAWNESTVFYSTSLSDPEAWKRKVHTMYQGGKLIWHHSHASSGSVYFCYFPPYSYERHLHLIQQCSLDKKAVVETLGQSLDGREIECVSVGTGERKCWIIHRQHPGEHMAEYYAEGLLLRLLGAGNDISVDKALSLYTFYIIPNMNPDGAVRGHLRTNACGANLNREWADSSNDYKAPTMERSPEVFVVLDKMKETGCDVFLDIHGDEALPFNFVAQPTIPNWSKRLESLHGAFVASYERANSDMQRHIAYETMNQPCSESRVLRIASSQVAARFNCLSVTLEMPFKDCRSNPDTERGWNPARSQKLGASVIEPLLYVHPHLRADGEFWNELPEEDAYVRPTSMYDS
jgi:murein tripeptide amidase MpaA